MRAAGSLRAADGGGGGGGGVGSVNGVLPIGGDVSLGASDIPFAGALAPSTETTVEGALDRQQTWLGTARVFWDEPTLDIVAPVGGGSTHSIAQTVIVTPPISGAPIFLASGRDMDFPHPGVLTTPGRSKTVIIADIDAPALTGEVCLENVTIGNINAGASAQDMASTSVTGRGLFYDGITFVGARAGSVTNATGPIAFFACVTAPPAVPNVKGVVLDGAIGNLIGSPCIAVAPGGFDYTAWTLAAGATVSDLLIFDTCTIQSARAGDRLFDFNTAATVPAAPDIGLRTQSSIITGPGSMYEAGGLNELSDTLSSAGHLGGPASRYLADLVWTAAPNPPILVDHSLVGAGVSVIMPSDNVSNGGAQSIGLAAVSERYSFDDAAGPLDWWINLIVGDRLIGNYEWRAVVSRSGAGTNLTGILQVDTGGGFQDDPATESLSIILTTAQKEIRGSVPARIGLTDRVRMMFRTSVPATGTLVHAYVLEAVGSP